MDSLSLLEPILWFRLAHVACVAIFILCGIHLLRLARRGELGGLMQGPWNGMAIRVMGWPAVVAWMIFLLACLCFVITTLLAGAPEADVG